MGHDWEPNFEDDPGPWEVTDPASIPSSGGQFLRYPKWKPYVDEVPKGSERIL